MNYSDNYDLRLGGFVPAGHRRSNYSFSEDADSAARKSSFSRLKKFSRDRGRAFCSRLLISSSVNLGFTQKSYWVVTPGSLFKSMFLSPLCLFLKTPHYFFSRQRGLGFGGGAYCIIPFRRMAHRIVQYLLPYFIGILILERIERRTTFLGFPGHWLF